MTKDKRGLSVMVGYILLIVIAASISVGIYAWMKTYIPKEEIKCPDSVSLVIKNYSCDSTNNILSMILTNKGLFEIDGFYIRGSNDTSPRPTINLKFGENDYFLLTAPLAPGADFSFPSPINYTQYNQLYKIEIVPFRFQKYDKKQKFVMCGDASITETLDRCT